MESERNRREKQQAGASELRLSTAERAEVRRHTALSVAVVHEAVRKEGEHELQRPPAALAWSGLAAGLSLGFSPVSEGVIRASLPDTSLVAFLAQLGYTVGFLIVILGRQQLFTEDTLLVILPLLHKFNAPTLTRVLRLWGIVLISNLIGTFIFAWFIGNTVAFEPAFKRTFFDIGIEEMSGGFLEILLRGIFAGWLIALLIWLLPIAETSRVIIIIILTFLIRAGKFSHIIAGSVGVLYLVVTGAIPVTVYFTAFAIPTLLGNIIGGVLLVAIINHAQVIAGRHL